MAQAAAQVLPGPPKEQVALPEEWQFSMQELEHSPSRKEGVSMEDELLWRSDCCQLVSDMTHKLQDKWGREDDRRKEEREQRRRKGQSSQKEKPFDPAKLPLAQHRKVVGTACALVHRFFIRRSFLQFDRRFITAGSLLVAFKAEDVKSIKLRDVVGVFMALRGLQHAGSRESEAFKKAQLSIERAEFEVLRVCEFDFNISNPWQFLRMALARVDGDKKIFRMATRCANTAIRTPLCLLLNSWKVAQGCVRFAAQRAGWPAKGTPEGDAWRAKLDLTEEDYGLMMRFLKVSEGGESAQAGGQAPHAAPHAGGTGPSPATTAPSAADASGGSTAASGSGAAAATTEAAVGGTPSKRARLE